MKIQRHVHAKKVLHVSILRFLESETNIEEKAHNIINLLQSQKILENIHEFRLFLFLITKICNNHNQDQYFFEKVSFIFCLLQ